MVKHQSAFDLLLAYRTAFEAHAPGSPDRQSGANLWRGIGFRLGEHWLLAPFDEVLEILPLPEVVPVPGAQPWMLGLVGVRGDLMPLVDVRLFLEGLRSQQNSNQKILVLRQPGGPIAILIDALVGHRSFLEQEVIEAGGPQRSDRIAYFVRQTFQQDERDWGVFDVRRLVRTPEFRQAAV